MNRNTNGDFFCTSCSSPKANLYSRSFARHRAPANTSLVGMFLQEVKLRSREERDEALARGGPPKKRACMPAAAAQPAASLFRICTCISGTVRACCIAVAARGAGSDPPSRDSLPARGGHAPGGCRWARAARRDRTRLPWLH